ncbi:hypothetical protein ASG52_25280 [Methylobacterium sp. Leaf456]|uniref:hypothetical protein n=1 Tax=Methylobacterium sp. Leaf456 TaxID=1736382 RepID=UPI0006FE13A1|nr:hypothetical protein [Methylobacterium sp. Leaf456]KQT55039.1 hypothetical protein ASG52_25280 [Methylobacterium sp. Leaf456]
MKHAQFLSPGPGPDLRQRAAALRNNMARAAPPKPGPAMPAPATVAAAVELDALPLAELLHVHDVAALIVEVCAAIGCQPRSLERGPDGAEQSTPAGQLAEWHRAACGALMDRCIERLEAMAEAAHRGGAAEVPADLAEALRTRL